MTIRSIVLKSLALITMLAGVLVSVGAQAAPSSAGRVGSPAWTNSALQVYAGPGTIYQPVGQVDGGLKIKALRCFHKWCKIAYNGPEGWVKQSHLNFGAAPGYPLDALIDNKVHAIVGGGGDICFYTGANYTGQAYCVQSGARSVDLKLQGLDNVFASIAIEGRHYVEVCTGRDLSAYCTRITQSRPSLNTFLHRSISSFWAH